MEILNPQIYGHGIYDMDERGNKREREKVEQTPAHLVHKQAAGRVAACCTCCRCRRGCPGGTAPLGGVTGAASLERGKAVRRGVALEPARSAAVDGRGG